MMTGDRLSQSTEAVLTERVKELTYLYGIAQVAAQPGISLEEIIQGIVKPLPPAWQYPETAFARIILDRISYTAQAYGKITKFETVLDKLKILTIINR